MPEKYDGELLRRLAALERRVNKLEMGMSEFDRVINPQGWIGEAFEQQEEYLAEKFTQMDNRLERIEGKVDAILQRLTGWSDTNT